MSIFYKKTRYIKIKTPRIQTHHISYNPEIVVKLYQGEHWLVSMLDLRKKISKGFIKCLKIWIEKNKHKAVKL